VGEEYSLSPPSPLYLPLSQREGGRYSLDVLLSDLSQGGLPSVLEIIELWDFAKRYGTL